MAGLPKWTARGPFPRWTGMRVHMNPMPGDKLSIAVTMPPLTRRVRLWLAWRLLTRQGVPDAAAQQ
jgi:hypothetical protein